MTPQRITVKFFAKPGSKVELPKFIGLFHRFIQKGSVEGLLVDVADYEHVPDGPGVLLIGHDVDYGMDMTGGKPGLLVRRKHFSTGLAATLRDTLRKGLRAIQAIEADGSTGVAYSADAVEIACVDKLATPNNDESLAAVKPVIESVLRDLYGPGVQLTRGDKDARRNLTLTAQSQVAANLKTLIGRLEAVAAA